MTIRRTREAWTLMMACIAALAGCSSPTASPTADAVDDASADAAADTQAPADVQAADIPPLLHPELDPALCGPVTPLNWSGVDPAYVPLSSGPLVGNAVQDRNWYVLTVLQTYPAANAAIWADPELQAMSQVHDDNLRKNAAVAWSSEDTLAAAKRVAAVLVKTDAVAVHLRKSGRFVLLHGKTDAELVEQAVAEALGLLANNFQTYAASRPDLKPMLIDIAAKHPAPALFFEPMLWSTVAGLMAAKQDQSGRYEPLALGHNQKALARLSTIKWQDWRFAVILGPGWGPDDLEHPLSDNGRDHADIVAERWKAGLAPFILVSGGHVHPSADTQYSEALEMKKYLISAKAVPEDAILVDPYARHTTTNLRNTSRMLLSSGFPPEKPALVSSDVAQAFYIAHLDTRCQEDLGYLPYRGMTILGEADDCFLPEIQAMQGDGRDERDP